MFKQIILGFLIFILSGIAGFTFVNRTKTIHIYMDFATLPAFLQMADFVRTPMNEKKIIAWRRHPNLPQMINLKKYNAQFVILPQNEIQNREALKKIYQMVQEVYKKNPKASYIIHSNLRWGENLASLLHIIPPKQVKHLYIYEDGVSNTVHSHKNIALNKKLANENEVNKLKKIIQKNNLKNYTYTLNFAFHRLYKTTYFFSFLDMIKQDPEFASFYKTLDGAELKPIDFNLLKKSLTPEQINTISQMVGFDKKAYVQQVRGRQTHFFLLGGDFVQKYDQVTAAKDFYVRFIEQEKEGVLVLKEHPWLSNISFKEDLQAKIPKAILFPRSVPMEILILTDLMPTSLSGYSSSTFFSFPSVKIIRYLTSEYDFYLHFFKKLNKIKDTQIDYLQNYEKEQPPK